MDENASLLHGVLRAREANELIDYHFVCKGQRYPVHKVVICAMSPVFKAACTGPVAQSNGESDLSEYSHRAVEEFRDYLYSGKCKDMRPGGDNVSDLASYFRLLAELFAMGDKYLIRELKSDANNLYAEGLKLDNTRVMIAFLWSIPPVYDSSTESSRALRDTAVSYAHDMLPQTLRVSKIQSAFYRATKDCPGFAQDLLWFFCLETKPPVPDWLLNRPDSESDTRSDGLENDNNCEGLEFNESVEECRTP